MAREDGEFGLGLLFSLSNYYNNKENGAALEKTMPIRVINSSQTLPVLLHIEKNKKKGFKNIPTRHYKWEATVTLSSLN